MTKLIKITCIPAIDSDEPIVTGEAVITLDRIESYAVAARIINAFRDWPHQYDMVKASDIITLIKSGGGSISGSTIEIMGGL